MDVEISVSSPQLGKEAVQVLAVPVFENERANEGFLGELNEATGGLVASCFEFGEMKGAEGETVLLHLPESNRKLGVRRLLLVGVGDGEEYALPGLFQMSGTAARALGGKNIQTLGIFTRFRHDDAGRVVSTVVEGTLVGQYEPHRFSANERQSRIERLVIFHDGQMEGSFESYVERGRIVSEAVNLTRDLANEPPLYMTPTIMAERAREMAERFGLEFDVLDETRMKREGMGALLGVAQGSEEPPKLIALKYRPSGAAGRNPQQTLALVGKGVTFDAGGISIKKPEHMDQMKYDMAGGAAVVGAMQAVARLKPSLPVLGLVPATENMPSGKAVKPSDVLRAMSGKTIEVINTDAEGRLILADAITYARKLGATHVVDMATLTGAVITALGDCNTAIMGNDQRLMNELIQTGAEIGEGIWQLPLDKNYSKLIKSDIADIKNYTGDKAATITAGAFLKEFAGGCSWAHMDIAGTAVELEGKPYRAKGATGVPVRTLVNFVEQMSHRGGLPVR